MTNRNLIYTWLLVLSVMLLIVATCDGQVVEIGGPRTAKQYVEAAQKEIIKVKAEANMAWHMMGEAYAKTGEVQIELGKQQGVSDQLFKRAEANERRLDKIEPKYHKLKTIACLIASAAAIFGVLSLPLPIIFAPYKLYALGGAAILAPLLVWILL